MLPYDEVIRLVFGDSGVHAWLEVKGYDTTPSGNLVVLGNRTSVGSESWTVNISQLLEVPDVIRFRLAVLAFKNPDPPDEPSYIQNVIDAGLKAVEVTGSGDWVSFAVNFPSTARNRTYAKIRNALEKANRLRNTGHDAEYAMNEFVAYFPDPTFVVQEERTKRGVEKAKGKTVGIDNRKLKKILSSVPVPPKNALELKIDAWDKESSGESSGESGEEAKKEKDKKKHDTLRLQGVCCFGFRGDSREPLEVKEANGLLSPFTRSDKDMMDSDFIGPSGLKLVSEVAEEIDGLRGKGSTSTLKEYLDSLKAFAILNLGEFTQALGEKFRAFVSTSKSIAIAKYFCNMSTKQPVDGEAWLYAVRCYGGYELPSHVSSKLIKQNQAELKKLHEFASKLEQEIAVPGAVWWEHVVGFRLVQYNKDGQFLAGPVYLRNDAYWKAKNDQAAARELFAVLSGKSQGKDPTIFKSYRKMNNPPQQEMWPYEPNPTDG